MLGHLWRGLRPMLVFDSVVGRNEGAQGADECSVEGRGGR